MSPTHVISNVERLIDEINRIHTGYHERVSKLYGGNLPNLSKTLRHLDVNFVLQYRLNLHESINDYLIRSDIGALPLAYYYRVKTTESVLDKIRRFSERESGYPANKVLNDIFGVRIIADSALMEEIHAALDEWVSTKGLKNWYVQEKNGYIGTHVYFNQKNNLFFPWELQIWDKADALKNIESHERDKRLFV